ncbi:hypothetical protein V2W45_1450491 [Cenococcum geophilum]
MAQTVDQKLLKRTKFPPEFSQKVDMEKVNVEVMKKWIAGKISEILGSEDDVVIELCFNLLENSRFPDIKTLQIQLTGFLEKETAGFCKELWTLCLSAQANPQGVPKELLEAKKLELIQEKIEAEKAAEEARRRREQERTRDKDIDTIRQRERGERGRGRGRNFRGGARDFDRRPPRRESRSPPRRRRGSDDYRAPPRREVDTYIPGEARRRDGRRRPRSPTPKRTTSSSHSRSHSITPPRRRTRWSPGKPTSRSPEPTPRRIYRRYLSRDRSHSRSRDRGGRVRRSSLRGDNRDRSISPIERSRSRSPRRVRSRRDLSLSSATPISPSPPRKRKERRRRSYSRSRSRSSARSASPRRVRAKRDYTARRSISVSDNEPREVRADFRKDRDRDNRRKRSRSRSVRSGSRSWRSWSPRQRKRHPSVERYEPRAKRRRNTSSVEGSPPPKPRDSPATRNRKEYVSNKEREEGTSTPNKVGHAS